MNVTPSVNGVKIYNVSMGKSLPQWIKDKKNKSGSLKKDDEFRRRIELIQDFDFPTASQKVKATPDGQFVVACGTYKPALRVWDLEQLTLKLSRNVDAEIVDFEILGQDWTKIASLRSDRYIDFMSSNGVFHNIQIPRTGRGLCYDRENCDLLSWGACGDVWRINLEQGRFLSSIETELDNINCGAINPLHQLMTFGGENGVVQCFDPRIRTSLATKDIRAYLTSHPEYSDVLESDPEITSLHHHTNGLVMGVGVSTGQVLLYDLRASEPLVIKDHRNSMPIKSIEFLEERRVLSADSKGLKFWEQDSGKPVAAVECQSTVNDVYHFPGTGLFLTANEQEKLMAFFIPSLSPAPKWCSFLDSLTEELEEDQQSVFEDYKFITREQCEQFGFANMIGTEYLKPYMHGYFIGIKLYNKLKAVTKPFEYDGYIQGKVDEKIKSQETSRISAEKKKRSQPKVNVSTATRLAGDTSKYSDVSQNLLSDPRFKELWEREEFKIDERNANFRTKNIPKVTQQQIEQHFEPVQEEEAEQHEDVAPVDPGEEKGFYELKTGYTLKDPLLTQRQRKMSFGARVNNVEHEKERSIKNYTGDMEMRFTPQDVIRERREKKQRERKEAEEDRERKKTKRGVQELHLGFIDVDKKRSYRKKK